METAFAPHRRGSQAPSVVVRAAAALLAASLTLVMLGCTEEDRANSPEIAFFYMSDCYKCDLMKDVLEDALASYPELSVEYFEWYSNESLLRKLARRYGLGNTINVPTIFVGDRAISGDGRTRELALRSAIEDCAANGCRAPLR